MFFSLFAATYETALKRLEKLRTRPYAFTTDAEGNPEEKVYRMKQHFAKRTIPELLDVPSLQNDSDCM